jgi:hypothetical protein
MNSTSLDAVKSINIYGHVSAHPEQIADALGGTVMKDVDPSCDVAIFAVNPAAGIDNDTIEMWRAFDDLQTPRMIAVTVLEGMELDFDDAVMLANRVFDQTITPYLVLHGENGSPIGTISLETLKTLDYSTNPPTVDDADDELVDVVQEFRDEYLERIEEMEDGAFAAGIIFPAIPLNLANGLGLDVIKGYLAELPSSS